MLREYKGGDPEVFRKYQAARFRPVEWVDDVLKLDEDWRNATTTINNMKKAIGKLQRDVIAPKKKGKENCDAEVEEVTRMKQEATRRSVSWATWWM